MRCPLAAALFALAIPLPALADLHVVQAVPVGDALLVRTKAREVFSAVPGAAVSRLGRLPEGASPLVSDGLTAVSASKLEDGEATLSVFDRSTSAWLLDLRRRVVVPDPLREGFGRPVAIDATTVYFSGGSRLQRGSNVAEPGHLPEHPDLRVVDAVTSAEGFSVLLCRGGDADPGGLWLVSSSRVRERLPGDAAGTRLVLDGERVLVVTPSGVTAYDARTLAGREDLAPMLPPGRVAHLSADDGGYWLEVEEGKERSWWRVDRETLDHVPVELAGIGEKYRTLGDTGDDLWFGRPGDSHSIVLMSAPKSGGGAQGYKATGRGERRTKAFFRRTGRALAITGMIVTFPISLPIAIAVSEN